jgi:hypothetical protein
VLYFLFHFVIFYLFLIVLWLFAFPVSFYKNEVEIRLATFYFKKKKKRNGCGGRSVAVAHPPRGLALADTWQSAWRWARSGGQPLPSDPRGDGSAAVDSSTRPIGGHCGPP